MDAQMLSAEDVSIKLGLCKRQIFRLDMQELIPLPVRIGGSIRWRKSDIDTWIDMNCPNRADFTNGITAEGRQYARLDMHIRANHKASDQGHTDGA